MVVEVGVEPPTEPSVEFLRAINIRDGDDDDFEFHVGWRYGRSGIPNFIGAHGCLLRCSTFRLEFSRVLLCLETTAPETGQVTSLVLQGPGLSLHDYLQA